MGECGEVSRVEYCKELCYNKKKMRVDHNDLDKRLRDFVWNSVSDSTWKFVENFMVNYMKESTIDCVWGNVESDADSIRVFLEDFLDNKDIV